jgi:RimJ/RimL family protein N-acetyltransferase
VHEDQEGNVFVDGDTLFRTRRLLLRCWRPSDAPALKQAIDGSLAHLRPWMPWALSEPSEVESIAARLASFRERFGAGKDWTFGVFDPGETEVLGGAGIHRRGAPDALEIGYWIRASVAGQGLGTEAAEALTMVGFVQLGAPRMEIRCDPHNLRSVGVPRRLGYRHLQTLVADTITPAGEPRDTMVWSLTVDQYNQRQLPETAK